MPMNCSRALPTARSSSSSLACIAAPSRFWLFWIRNTIRKVMMVVPVLMMSCQVSEKWNTGPVTAQTRITSQRDDERQRLAGRGRGLGRERN